jgi:stearoyl-CoA desaturase (delta-9 desaturase)
MNTLLSRHENRRWHATTLVVVIVPFLILVYAILQLWNRDATGVDLVLCGGLYAVAAMGITVGFHRLITHRRFVAVWPWSLVLLLGSMAVEGPVVCWVTTQWERHGHGDHEGEPHSPP